MTVSRGLCGTSHFSCSFFMPFSLDFVIFVYFTNFKFFKPWSDIAAFRSPILVVRTVFVVKVQHVLVQPSRPSAFRVHQKSLSLWRGGKISLTQPSRHFVRVRSLSF